MPVAPLICDIFCCHIHASLTGVPKCYDFGGKAHSYLCRPSGVAIHASSSAYRRATLRRQRSKPRNSSIGIPSPDSEALQDILCGLREGAGLFIRMRNLESMIAEAFEGDAIETG